MNQTNRSDGYFVAKRVASVMPKASILNYLSSIGAFCEFGTTKAPARQDARGTKAGNDGIGGTEALGSIAGSGGAAGLNMIFVHTLGDKFGECQSTNGTGKSIIELMWSMK